uniref:Uncharacterized protein n=1 Tax=Anguilla anguilla TaxID=7936 RepID=A0A0E9RCF9_ANGAN
MQAGTRLPSHFERALSATPHATLHHFLLRFF